MIATFDPVNALASTATTNIDVDTLFAVTTHVEIMLGLLLFFVWTQNMGKQALAWWGSAHLLRAVSIMLFVRYGSAPDWLSLDAANAALFGSFALLWCGARVFDRRPPEIIWSLVGIAIWLLACRTSQFASSPEFRALVAAAIVAAYTWLTAFELWRGRAEALVSRWPAMFMLFAHGALFLVRTPLGAMLNLSPNSSIAMSGLLELVSIEALLFTISIAFILLAMAKERTEYRHRTAARTDALTGIANRRGLLEQTVPSKRRSTDLPTIAVLLFDLDRFKSINDRYGHVVGDRALQIFADVAKASIGADGMVGRWGGDEFAAVIYGTTREHAGDLGERIQTAYANAAVDIGGKQVRATVSTGMVFSAAGPLDLPALLLLADQALYRAKQNGRNRLEISVADPDRTHDVRPLGQEVAIRRQSAA